MNPAPPISTARELLGAGDIGRCELVRGRLAMMSPAGANHGGVVGEIHGHLWAFVRQHRLGKVYGAETGFTIASDPDTVRAPDVAFVAAERVHLIGIRGFFPGAPDLAVEVLSPDDAPSYVLAKVRDWLDAGTTTVWVVDPLRRVAFIHRRGAAVRAVSESEDLADEILLPGFRVPLAEVL
jgi:Uma2 family endonuclease